MKIKTKKIYIYKCRFIITEDLDAVIGCFIAVIVQCQGIMLFHEKKKYLERWHVVKKHTRLFLVTQVIWKNYTEKFKYVNHQNKDNINYAWTQMYTCHEYRCTYVAQKCKCSTYKMNISTAKQIVHLHLLHTPT